MNRKRLWTACGVLAIAAVAAGAWAGESAPRWESPPSRLKEIKDLLSILGIFVVVGLAGLGSAGLMLLAAATSADRVARAEGALRRGRWATLLVGAVTAAALTLVALGLAQGARGAPGAALLALLGFLGFLVWLGAVGMAASARIVGQRLLKDDEGAQSPWRLVGAGALVLGAVLLVPFAGPLIFLYFFCRGVGAATLTLLSKT